MRPRDRDSEHESAVAGFRRKKFTAKNECPFLGQPASIRRFRSAKLRKSWRQSSIPYAAACAFALCSAVLSARFVASLGALIRAQIAGNTSDFHKNCRLSQSLYLASRFFAAWRSSARMRWVAVRSTSSATLRTCILRMMAERRISTARSVSSNLAAIDLFDSPA